MVGFVERRFDALFQTQTSKNRSSQKEQIHVNVSRVGGGGGGRGVRVNLPLLGEDVILLYERPICNPHLLLIIVVSNFR